MRSVLLWVAGIAVPIVPCAALANPLPSVWLSDTGVLVPANDARVDVLDQQLTIALPEPQGAWPGQAVIRSEYTLRSRYDEAVDMFVGWPTGASGSVVDNYESRPIPYVKFDAKPVGWNYLTFDDLAEEYVTPMLQRIDQLLEARPALRDEVRRLRDEQRTQGKKWSYHTAASQLIDWMRKEGLIKDFRIEYYVAMGLLGVAPYASWGPRRDFCVQRALQWLDPTYEATDVFGAVSNRWGHDTRVLHPDNGQLIRPHEEHPRNTSVTSRPSPCSASR